MLYKAMDPEGAGLISYVEFETLVREALFVNPDELSHEELKRVWMYMDRDMSGGATSRSPSSTTQTRPSRTSMSPP